MLALGIILSVLCLLFLVVILIRQNQVPPPPPQQIKDVKPDEEEHGKH